VCGAGYRHRPTHGATDTIGERLAVLEVLRRNVAGGARYLAVAAQPRVEEKVSTERCSLGVVGIAIRCVGADWFEALQ
jgi:hypothetical protein